ncbi:hypothetical protein GS885_15905 [Rhodococcus hoagii]|nr:hypothetical protein [Prescottella equi]
MRIHRRRNGDVVDTIVEHVVVAGQVGFHCPAAASAAAREVWASRTASPGTVCSRWGGPEEADSGRRPAMSFPSRCGLYG